MAEHGETPTDEPFKPDWMNYSQGFLDGSAEEREACLKVCEEVEQIAYELWDKLAHPEDQGKALGARLCIDAILARNKK